ncbi:carboxypeptidase-like regulatory domain-containing protein [Muricauda sp. MAR_2010_75]|uniref:carboxypeptidase-like regulatory domain-containing protein n=1 Tax=Allomuricauda sp. MAR_2010_75 TaxID=1250232 RepID=UPI00068D8B0D|nr:carboxypeptidase-like regulatory domain-containing protein [Muricauda sp. MAR_2010_75]
MKNTILLLFFMLVMKLCAQNSSVSGKVFFKLDSSALPGATVLISGSEIGTQADYDGNFELSGLNQGKYDIIVEFVGYGKDTIKNVVLKKNSDLHIDLGLPSGPCYQFTDSNKCPIDGSSKNVIPIIYGLPGKKLMRKMKKGKIKLGGCEVTGCEPNWFCVRHQKEF